MVEVRRGARARESHRNTQKEEEEEEEGENDGLAPAAPRRGGGDSSCGRRMGQGGALHGVQDR